MPEQNVKIELKKLPSENKAENTQAETLLSRKNQKDFKKVNKSHFPSKHTHSHTNIFFRSPKDGI